jgi:TolB-like protein/Flp pilus assembly protein TadD
MAVLCHLAERAGTTVSREELLDAIWKTRHVVEDVLTRCVSQLRQLLGDRARSPRYIHTVPKVGYRLLITPEPVAAAHTGASSPEPARERSMLAVLPFDNLSGDPAFEYVSDGFTDAIITELGVLNPERLAVISRISAMIYKGNPDRKTVRQIARELSVQYVLAGSVRQSGGRLMISAQLIHAQDQTQLWGRNYESPMRDVLQLQSAVAGAVAHEIGPQLTIAGRQRVPTTVDPVVYDQYLKGRYSWNKRTDAGLGTAINHFEQALEIDKQFAPAQCALASCWTFRCVYGPHAPRDTLPIARAAALRAIELDERSSEAHAALGLALSWLDHDWDGGERELKRAIELDPNNATAHQWYASWLGMLRRDESALRETSLALQLDPLSPSTHFAHALVLSLTGNDHAAAIAAEKALAHNPHYYLNRVVLGHALCRIGRLSEGIDHLRLVCKHSGDHPDALTHLACGYAISAMIPEAHSLLARIVNAPSQASPYYLARLHACVGNLEEAVDCLYRAYDERSMVLMAVGTDPFLPAVHEHPRYRRLVATMKVPTAETQ